MSQIFLCEQLMTYKNALIGWCQKMVQWLRMFIPSEDLGQASPAHMVAHIYQQLLFQRIKNPLLISAGTKHTCTLTYLPEKFSNTPNIYLPKMSSDIVNPIEHLRVTIICNLTSIFFFENSTLCHILFVLSSVIEPSGSLHVVALCRWCCYEHAIQIYL